MRPLDEFCCQNEQCSDFGKYDFRNITHRGWSGRTKTIRLLICSTCGVFFSERKGSIFSECRLPIEKSMEVLQHLENQVSIRQTARLAGVDKNTVNRLAKLYREKASRSSRKVREL